MFAFDIFCSSRHVPYLVGLPAPFLGDEVASSPLSLVTPPPLFLRGDFDGDCNCEHTKRCIVTEFIYVPYA